MQRYLLIIMLYFTYGETKIHSNIKKSQTIMAIISWKILFCFLYLYYELQLSKKVKFSLKFTFSFYKNILDQTLTTFNVKFDPQWKDWKSNQVKRNEHFSAN